jgi:hypothetical protein
MYPSFLEHVEDIVNQLLESAAAGAAAAAAAVDILEAREGAAGTAAAVDSSEAGIAAAAAAVDTLEAGEAGTAAGTAEAAVDTLPTLRVVKSINSYQRTLGAPRCSSADNFKRKTSDEASRGTPVAQPSASKRKKVIGAPPSTNSAVPAPTNKVHEC